MDAFARLLVAVDGSPPSHAGAAFAMQLAEADRAMRLRFVTVVDIALLAAESADGGVVLAGIEEVFDASRVSARRCVDDAIAQARRSGVDADGTVREGKPVDELLEEAHRWAATCIVMGTHGREGVVRALLGSCTEGLLRQSDLPVLVVRGSRGASNAAPIRGILCALDGSPPSDAAFATALAIAGQRQARLELLTIVQIDDAYAEAYEKERFDPDGTIAGLYAAARSPLENLASQAEAQGVESETRVIGASRVAETIVAYASESLSDLIVLGTHGRHGIERAFLGSTAEAVLRHSTVPVLAVHKA
jgi:nucleotide-binding universal stress UspA family protein